MTSRPRRDILDGTITDPDQARRVMVTLARQVTAKPVWATGDVERMAALVLWMDAHLSTGGVLPTQWAEDGTIPRKPVTTVPLPAGDGLWQELASDPEVSKARAILSAAKILREAGLEAAAGWLATHGTAAPLTPPAWQVTDNITGQPVREGMTQEVAERMCRGLNSGYSLGHGPGGRYKAEPAR